MIRALIIDDNVTCQENLQGLLKLYCPDVKVLDIASCVDSALQKVQQHNPDVIFLDVELGDQTAFDLLDSITNINFNIIFISGHEHYSLQAIKHSALDYLLKPIDPDMLIQAVEKTKVSNPISTLQKQVEILMQRSSAPGKIALPSSTGLTFTQVDDIVHCQSEGSYSRITLNNQEKDLLISRNLSDLEKMLPANNFFRVHKSHLINKVYLKEFLNRDGGYVILDNGANIPVARNRKNDFLASIKSK